VIRRTALPVIRSPDHAITQLTHCCSPDLLIACSGEVPPRSVGGFCAEIFLPPPWGRGWPAIPMHFIGTRGE
jgi:hypothetical protein